MGHHQVDLVHVVGIKKEERKREADNLFEAIMMKNFQMWRNTRIFKYKKLSKPQDKPYPKAHYNQTIEYQRKDRIMKAGREKQQNKWSSMTSAVDISAEILQTRRQWNDIKCWKKNNLSTENSISGKTIVQKCETKISQINKHWGSSLQLELSCKKYQRESFKLKLRDIREQFKAIWMYKVLVKINTWTYVKPVLM